MEGKPKNVYWGRFGEKSLQANDYNAYKIRTFREGHRSMWAAMKSVHKERTNGKTIEHNYEYWEFTYICQTFLLPFIPMVNEILPEAKKLCKERMMDKNVEKSDEDNKYATSRPILSQYDALPALKSISRLRQSKGYPFYNPKKEKNVDKLPEPNRETKNKWAYDLDILEEEARNHRGLSPGDTFWSCRELFAISVCL